MDINDLKIILNNHEKWLNVEGGEKANLRGANLIGADLREADLRGANLREADLPKRFITICCIGSRNDQTTYCFEDNKIWCGCFVGTLEDFEIEINKTHKNNERYLKEYIGAINYIRSLI